MNSSKLSNISIKTIFFFILKLWILTNMISSFLFIAINDYGISESVISFSIISEKVFWKSVFFVFLIGLIYSIPAMIILGLIIKSWTRNKFLLVCVSVFLVILTFFFTGSMGLKDPKIYVPTPPLIYSVIISILMWTIPLVRKKQTHPISRICKP